MRIKSVGSIPWDCRAVLVSGRKVVMRMMEWAGRQGECWVTAQDVPVDRSSGQPAGRYLGNVHGLHKLSIAWI